MFDKLSTNCISFLVLRTSFPVKVCRFLLLKFLGLRGYFCFLLHSQEGALETLGKILLQDSFVILDPKNLRRKGKERHIFLFEQALLFSKERKDSYGKVRYMYKNKMKVSHLLMVFACYFQN